MWIRAGNLHLEYNRSGTILAFGQGGAVQGKRSPALRGATTGEGQVVKITSRKAVIVGLVIVGALIACFLTPVARAAGPITDDTVDSAVTSAKTPEEHEALAAYFTSKAEAASAMADKHANMGKSHPFTGKAHNESWGRHCNNLIKAYRQEAQSYLALAKQQQELAKGGKGM